MTPRCRRDLASYGFPSTAAVTTFPAWLSSLDHRLGVDYPKNLLDFICCFADEDVIDGQHHKDAGFSQTSGKQAVVVAVERHRLPPPVKNPKDRPAAIPRPLDRHRPRADDEDPRDALRRTGMAVRDRESHARN